MIPGSADNRRAKVRSANLPTHRGQAVHPLPRLTSQIDFDLWQERLHDPVSLIVLDLFCGAGGMSLGFADEGFVIGAGLDADEQACETFAANFPARALRLNLSDVKCPDDARDVIKRLDLPRVDIIIGGPPVRGSLSLAGHASVPCPKRSADSNCSNGTSSTCSSSISWRGPNLSCLSWKMCRR